MNMEIILDFFYEKASSRIKEKVTLSGLTHREIYKPDSKQISWIINNNRTKNNKYLITDAILGCTDTNREETGLLYKLSFTNIKEILWGTDEEIIGYLFDLFKLLWNEVTKESNSCQIDKELFLCDYVPYAKYSTYWNILFNPQNIFPAIAYGIREDTVLENIDSAREDAFRYLYSKCKNDFTSIFINFANDTNSFHKINKVFRQKFIDELFIPMLSNYKPDTSSLGLRVKNLIESDLLFCAPLVCLKVKPENNYISNLISASSEYILALEKIQEEYCSEFE